MESFVRERFIKYINNVIDTKKISHAFLIEVNNYDDDYQMVLNFIKMILCNINYEELSSCNNPIIKQIDNNDYPDLYTVSSDTGVINKASLINLQKEFSNKSLLDNKKIYIIKEAEKLNASSANTILKFLEEPADNIIAFLLTSNRYSIIETILSRCQILSLLENKSVDITVNCDIDFMDYFLNPNNYFIKYKDFMNDYYIDKSDFKNKLINIENIIVNYLDESLSNDSLNNYFSKYDRNKLINIITVLEEEMPKLVYNINTKLWIDRLFSCLIGG